MILIYTKSVETSLQEADFAAKLGGKVCFRAARLWRGEIEADVAAVYSDSEEIRKAYEARGVKTAPVTQDKPAVRPKEPEAPKKTVKKRAPRKKSS